jgi:hypothetical protein
VQRDAGCIRQRDATDDEVVAALCQARQQRW